MAVGRRVVLADEDESTREELSWALTLDGFQVQSTSDGCVVLELLTHPADVVILGVDLHRLDGLTVCRDLRSRGDRTPVLMISERNGIDDRIDGLDAGADDYLAKPCDQREVLARIRALLRRSDRSADLCTQVALGDLTLDLRGLTATRNGRVLSLTKTEYMLLELLVRNRGIVLTQTTIYEDIWGFDFRPESKNLTVFVLNLRRKMEAMGEPRLIHTVRGVGYVARTAHAEPALTQH